MRSLEFVYVQIEHFGRWDPLFSPTPSLAVGFTMNIFHVHFEVVISCKLLVAKLTFCHRSIGVVSQLVSDQHLLQAEGQITNLRQWRQDKDQRSLKTSSIYNTLYATSPRPQTHIPAIPINEFVFGGITPSESNLKIITLSGIFQCHTPKVVTQ